MTGPTPVDGSRPVIGVVHLRPTEDEVAFHERAEAVLAALAGRPGFVRGTIGRATDDETAWVMLTEWESVGAYRRGLGAFEVKVIAPALMAQAVDAPSAFEALVSVEPGGSAVRRPSDRAADADWVGR